MKLTILFLTGLILSACMQQAESPKSVAEKYWQLLQAGNTAEAEKLVSIKSRPAFTEHTSRMDAISQINSDEAKTIVSTTVTTINPNSNYKRTETFDTVLVLEQGKWKVDINQSQIPPAPGATEEELQQLAEELSESMQENIDSIDETMSQGMRMLNEALRDGSKEMGDSLLHLMNELNDTMKESIDKMKKRREQQQQQQQNQPDPDKGEGMI